MSVNKEAIVEKVNALKQQRDELKLKIHLAGREAKDEWERLEKEWEDMQESLEPLKEAVEEAASSAGEQAEKVKAVAVEVAPDKLKNGYEKLRKLIDRD